jgi:nickel-dependent lactate racemase
MSMQSRIVVKASLQQIEKLSNNRMKYGYIESFEQIDNNTFTVNIIYNDEKKIVGTFTALELKNILSGTDR